MQKLGYAGKVVDATKLSKPPNQSPESEVAHALVGVLRPRDRERPLSATFGATSSKASTLASSCIPDIARQRQRPSSAVAAAKEVNGRKIEGPYAVLLKHKGMVNAAREWSAKKEEADTGRSSFLDDSWEEPISSSRSVSPPPQHEHAKTSAQREHKTVLPQALPAISSSTAARDSLHPDASPSDKADVKSTQSTKLGHGMRAHDHIQAASVRSSMVFHASRSTRIKQAVKRDTDSDELREASCKKPQRSTCVLSNAHDPADSKTLLADFDRKVDYANNNQAHDKKAKVPSKHMGAEKQDHDSSRDLCAEAALMQAEEAASNKHMQLLEESTLGLKKQLQAAHSAVADLMEEVTKLRREKAQLRADLSR
jgi:hypothetical protein